MQLLSRLMDHALEARGERTTIVVATSGDTGGAAVEAFRGRARADLFVLFPQGRISDVQRRMMTTAEDDNVHALAIEGTFDDCQAIVKGMFNHHAFRDQARLSGVNSINWARIVAQVVYYFTAAVALGSPAPQGRLHGADRQFRRRLCRLRRAAHGPADRPPADRHQRQRHPRAHGRNRQPTSRARWCRPPRHRWTSRWRRISSACCSTPMAATGARCAPDGLARPVAALRRFRRARSRRSARCSPPTGRTRTRPPRPSAPCCARPAISSIRIPPSASRSPKRKRRDPSVPMVVLGTAHAAKFPDAVEAACGVRPPLPEWLADLRCAAGARRDAAGRPGGGRAPYPFRQSRCT